MRFVCAWLLLALAVHAQSAPSTGGVEAEWDLRKLLEALVAGANKLKPVVDQVNPQNWQNAQAAKDYAPLWQSAENEIQYLSVTTRNLSKEPERLTLALETYFRLQSLQSSITSLADGVRKHQNPAVADLVLAALMENVNNRERLRMYIAELAQNKEHELKIMDQEAQRCRGMIIKQPQPSKPGRKQ